MVKAAAIWTIPQAMSRPFGVIRLFNGGEATVDESWNSLHARHRSHVHVLYEILSGSCAIEIDGTWQELAAGTLWLLPANHWHRRRVVGTMVKRFLHFRLGSVGLDLALPRAYRIHAISHDALWREAMAASLALWGQGFMPRPDAPIAPRWRIEAMIQQLVATLLPEAPSEDDDPLLGSALAYLDHHHQRRPTVAAVAASIGCSERTLSGRFQRAFGIPVAAYAEHRRMEEAERLLVTSTMSVAEVAAACGYPDPLHFSRVVRRHFGRSPRDLRRRQA